MAFAPMDPLFGVPSRVSISWSMSRCSLASKPISAGPISSRTASTACSTPLPPYRLGSPSRRSTASKAPVEAPEGTAARAMVPSSRAISTSTVGLPRESRTSRAPTASMIAIRLSCGMPNRYGPSLSADPPCADHRPAARNRPRGSRSELAGHRTNRCAQGGLRVLAVLTRLQHEREESRAEVVAGRRALSQVEPAGRRQTRGHLVCASEGGKAVRYAVHGRAPVRLLVRLDQLPVGRHVLGGLGVTIGEHVRVTTDQLVHDAAGHVVDPERHVSVLLRHPRVEEHLQQDVAELLCHVHAVPGLDGLDQLVGLLDEVRHERLVSLLRVPGAAICRTQTVHHRDQVEQACSRHVIGPDNDLDLWRVGTRGDCRGQRIGQTGVAVGGTDPDHLSVDRPVEQQLGQRNRGHLAKVHGRNTRLLYGDQLGLVLIPGEDVDRVGQRCPRIAGEQAGGDARGAEQQGESMSHHVAGAHLAGDGAPALIQFGSIGVSAICVTSKAPYRGLTVILTLPSSSTIRVLLAWSSFWIDSCIWTNAIVEGEGLATLSMTLRASETETVLPTRSASSRTYGARIRLSRASLTLSSCPPCASVLSSSGMDCASSSLMTRSWWRTAVSFTIAAAPGCCVPQPDSARLAPITSASVFRCCESVKAVPLVSSASSRHAPRQPRCPAGRLGSGRSPTEGQRCPAAADQPPWPSSARAPRSYGQAP